MCQGAYRGRRDQIVGKPKWEDDGRTVGLAAPAKRFSPTGLVNRGADRGRGKRRSYLLSSDEKRRLTAEQEVFEVAPAIGVETDDLAVDQGAVRADGMGQFLRGQDLDTWALRETSWHSWPSICARARSPSNFGSKS